MDDPGRGGHNGGMSKPSTNKTPDWPYDMERVVRDLGLRHRDARLSVAILAAALYDLGHNAFAKTRTTHTSTWRAADNDDGRSLCFTKQSECHVVELNGKILTPALISSWSTLLHQEHDRHRAGAANGAYDVETQFYGQAHLLGEVLGTDAEIAAAVQAMEAHPNPDYAGPPAAVGTPPLLGHLVHERSEAIGAAKSLCLALRDQGMPATIFEDVRRTPHHKCTEVVSVFYLEHGTPERETRLTGKGEDGIGSFVTTCSSGPHGQAPVSGFIDVHEGERERLKRWRAKVEPIATALVLAHLDTQIPGAAESPRLRM